MALAIIAIPLLSIVPFSLKSAEAAVPSGFSDNLVASGLELPTAMEFAPDGRLFVSEKGGDLRVIKNGALLSQPFASVPVNSSGERGLLGIAFDPDFVSNGHVYIYYTTDTDPVHNRVSRLTADPANPDKALPGSEVSILELESQSTEAHVGGALEFGPDGKLYISVGENYSPQKSQSLTSRFGKILRINPDGTIPSDNPFYNVEGAYKEIWALGLRNPFTLQFSSDGSKMYIADVGQNSQEEVNQGLRGANYGWPTCEGSCDDPRFVNPLYNYSTSTGGAIVGGPFYNADQFPSEYEGSYFFGDYVQGFIKMLLPTNQAIDFATGLNSPVDIEQGPDGSIYYVSIGSGQVHKITYGTPGPNAMATASSTSGPAPLTVNFSGARSSSPTASTLTYSWNFGDGTTADGISASHTYTENGPFDATLTVTDSGGKSDTATARITVATPPVARIDTPNTGANYNAGDTISFSGSATDSEDGALPASAFKWNVLFHHNTHTHPFREYSGVSDGNFTIPTAGETAEDVWYRIYLTVTDSDGLTHTVTRDIMPNKAKVTITGNIPGLQVLLDGQPHTMPYSFVGVVGMTRTLDAPVSQVLGLSTLNFSSWSDGGGQMHTISTPATNATITATYAEESPEPSTRTITINSADMSGEATTGFYTTIATDGNVVFAGYTPVTFIGNKSSTYTISVGDYDGAIFSHWEDNGKTRTRSLILNDDETVTAYYKMPSQNHAVSIKSVDASGNDLAGYYTTVRSDDRVVATGFTPFTFNGTAGTKYTVSIADYISHVFDHWENGSTDRPVTFILDSDRELVAHYNSTSARVLTVTSSDMSGGNLTGMYATVSAGGEAVASGFTPLRFVGNVGTTYTVSVNDYGSYVFDHWGNGSTARERQVILNSDTYFRIFYRLEASQ